MALTQSSNGYYVACICVDCGEIIPVRVCNEYGYNPGVDGHGFETPELAQYWADKMNDDFDTEIYFVIHISMERVPWTLNDYVAKN